MRRDKRTGQTLLLFSLTSVVIFGLTGLVVDLGWASYRRGVAYAAAQAAASAAVTAGVAAAGASISCSSSNVVCQAETVCPSATVTATTNTDKGCLYALGNGFSTGARQSVTIAAGTSTLQSGNGAQPRYWVVVTISEQIPQLFSTFLGKPYATITAKSTAGYFPPATGGCIYVMNPTSQSIQLNGNIILQTSCGLNVESSAYNALRLVGSAGLVATGGSPINVVGGYVLDMNSSISPLPTTGVSTFRDPLADVPPPTFSGCDSSGVSLGNNQTATISPGVYCGSITVTGHATLTLSPGLYVISSGNLSVGGQATLLGAGVTIYLHASSATFAGGATTDLSAPSSGAWQSVLFYQNRSNTTSASLVGGSGQKMSGILYFPTASLDYTAGSSTTGVQTTIICDTLNVTGNSYISSSGNSPFLTLFSGVGIIE